LEAGAYAPEVGACSRFQLVVSPNGDFEVRFSRRQQSSTYLSGALLSNKPKEVG
jgi:hypothetical protein